MRSPMKVAASAAPRSAWNKNCTPDEIWIDHLHAAAQHGRVQLMAAAAIGKALSLPAFTKVRLVSTSGSSPYSFVVLNAL